MKELIEAFEKVQKKNKTYKTFRNMDKININTALTNDITNALENLNSHNDILCNSRDNQEEYTSAYFDNNIELYEDPRFVCYDDESLMSQFKSDTAPINNETINLEENSISSLSFNDINNNFLMDSDFFGLNDDLNINEHKRTIKPPSFFDLKTLFKDTLCEQKKIPTKFCLLNNKRGRISKKSQNIKGLHTKEDKDNIERRVKVFFYESILDYGNELIREYQSQNGVGTYPLLKDIHSKIKKKSSKKDNLKLLENNVRDMLSQKISSKYTKFPSDYNKKVIDKIYREGKAKEIINFLNNKVLILYNKFIENGKKSDKFKTLAFYIESLKEESDENYLESVVTTAKNFEENIRKKRSKENKKKKDIISQFK
jgi:hypothetical protein